MKRTILIPTDFSEVCNTAVEYGAKLARSVKADIVLYHAVTSESERYMKQNGFSEKDLFTMMEKTSVIIFDEYAVHSDVKITRNDLFGGISQMCNLEDPFLIILGTHGKKGFQKISGGYVSKVLSLTGVPVLTVHKNTVFNDFKNLAFPVSLNFEDRQKFNMAVKLAGSFKSRVHVIPKYEGDRLRKSKIMNIVKQIKDYFSMTGLPVVDNVTDPKAGRYSSQILDYSAKNNIDMIFSVFDNDRVLNPDKFSDRLIYNKHFIPVLNVVAVKPKVFDWANSR